MRSGLTRSLGLVLAALTLAGTAAAQTPWDRTEVTSTMLTLSVIPVSDDQETDFCPVDINMDGAMDCVVGRKIPFTVDGERVNVLLINDGTGHLIDLTTTYTDFTNNLDNTRDVVCADMNNDGWPDILFANSENDPTKLYLNNGNDAFGSWLGLAAPIDIFQTPGAHNFCAIGVLDYDNDGLIDFYRADYSSNTEDQLFRQDPSNPLTFINTTSSLPAFGSNFEDSSFSTDVDTFTPDGAMLDLNGDGFQDLLVNSTLGAPSRVKVAYSDGVGGWLAVQQLSRNATYSLAVGDFDGDGRTDVFKQNDGTDYYNLNTSTNPDGTINEGPDTNVAETGGLGANSLAVDFDADGDLDIVIHPIDVDIQNCGNTETLEIFENTGGNPLFVKNNTGGWTRPMGTFDAAVADFDCDGLPDVLTSQCSGSGWRYFVSGGPGCGDVFTAEFNALSPSGYEFRVSNVPHPSGGAVTLYNLFDLTPENPTGSGPILGLGGEVLTQLAAPLGTQPFSVIMPNGVNTYVFPIPFVPPSIPSVDFNTLMVDFAAGQIEALDAQNFVF